LAKLSVTCRWVVANMVVPSTDCAFCTTMRCGQRKHLQQLGTLAPGLIQVSLFPHEIRGVSRLTEVARAIYGEGYG